MPSAALPEALTAGASAFAAQPGLALVWLVPLGAAAGSFINCLADRIPRRLGLRHPPSRCDSCGTTLGWRELIPLFSWLIQRGRCRHCRARVPARNFWLEVLTTATPILLFWLAGGGWPFVPLTLAAWLATGFAAVRRHS